MPDVVYVEPGFSPEVIRGLEARGHTVRATSPFGSANSIAATADGLVGAADPRTRGSLAVGE
jgi:gamma-glutamyltranspeptidase/glutathione hydrolase